MALSDQIERVFGEADDYLELVAYLLRIPSGLGGQEGGDEPSGGA
jgi:hypothetical protein